MSLGAWCLSSLAALTMPVNTKKEEDRACVDFILPLKETVYVTSTKEGIEEGLGSMVYEDTSVVCGKPLMSWVRG